jgi:hypothetical protein
MYAATTAPVGHLTIRLHADDCVVARRQPLGKRTQRELHGYGQNQFVPWPLGAIT